MSVISAESQVCACDIVKAYTASAAQTNTVHYVAGTTPPHLKVTFDQIRLGATQPLPH
jgi:hypothetical protein